MHKPTKEDFLFVNLDQPDRYEANKTENEIAPSNYKRFFTIYIGFIILLVALSFVLINYITDQTALRHKDDKASVTAKKKEATKSVESNEKTDKQLQTASFKLGSMDDDFPIINNSHAIYQLDLKMDVYGRFNVKATIQVKNLGDETWNDLVFYFMPNEFTNENKPDALKSFGIVQMGNVTVDGSDTPYILDHDTLQLKLANNMTKGQDHQVSIQYSFTVPENCLRLGMFNGNYYLAQWYPMLANYSHGWLKHPYIAGGSETYHSAFTDFTVTYQIPKGFIFTSSSPEENSEITSGVVKATNVKEMYIAILKNQQMQLTTVDGINVRLFAPKGEELFAQSALETAKQALHYFNEKIGKYPYPELDLVVGNAGMEYPGIVSILNTEDLETNIKTVIHEIAHQWFYGMVSEDPFTDGWLDEGLTSLATAQFSHFSLGEPIDLSYEVDLYSNHLRKEPAFSNLPLDQFPEHRSPIYLYGQPLLKLKELFESQGGLEKGEKFLADYFRTYQFKEVNTEEFVRFTKEYFHLENKDFFKSWLVLKDA